MLRIVFLRFMLITFYLCVHGVGVCTQKSISGGDQKVSDPLEMELEWFLAPKLWVLETQDKSLQCQE